MADMPPASGQGLMAELYEAITSSDGPEVRMSRAVAMWAHDEIVRLRDNEAWRDERHEYEQLTGRMAYLLTATANMLKGEPESHVLHDWSDLPDVAAAVKRRATRDDDDDPGPIGTERVD